jgi:FkbM family methyltransferase
MSTIPCFKFLGSTVFGRLLSDVGPISCLDIGARGGPKDDLLSIAPATNIYCFEPDKIECERLNIVFSQNGRSPFNDVRFFPVALSRTGGKRTLHITEHAGASSLLAPLPDVGSNFSRAQYTEVVKTLEVDTIPLDDFANQSNLAEISYIKIDVEGLELEILQSAPRMLAKSVLAIRTEVSFLRYREAQPLYCDVSGHLKTFDFVPMGFAELHHWRRYSTAKHLKVTDDPIPFSRGQIAHGDMLFFRNPDSLPVASEEDLCRQIKAAFLAMSYGFIDHAAYILSRKELIDILKTYDFNMQKELRTVALELARQWNYTKVGKYLGRRKKT